MSDPTAALNEARTRQQRGDWPGGLRLLEELAQTHADNPVVLAHLASALKQAGRLVESVERLRQALRVDGKVPEVWFNLGNTLHQLGRLEEAERSYRRALELNSGLVPALFNLGNVLRDRERPGEAEQCYRSVIRLQPEFPTAYTNLGNLLRKGGRPAEAAECHRAVLQRRPGDPNAYFNLGNALSDSGHTAEAIDCYQRALAAAPTHGDALLNLAHAQRRGGDSAAAETNYRRALEAAPTSLLAVRGLAGLLVADERFEEAESLLRPAVDAEPRDGELLRLLAAALHKSQAARQNPVQLQEAAHLYHRALAVEPDHVPTLQVLGLLLHDLGRIDETLECWRRVLVIEPDNSDAHTNLGTLLKSLKRHQPAIEHFRAAIRVAADSTSARIGLAFTLLELGQIGEPLAIADEILTTHRDLADVYHLRGCCLVEQARIEEGLAAFREALRLQPAEKSTVISNLLFSSLYGDHYEAAAVTALHRELGGEIVCGKARNLSSDRRLGTHDLDRPLRIGYLSADLKQHPVGIFIEQIMHHHDPAQGTVWCYARVGSPDETTARMRRSVPYWCDCFGWPDERLADRIRADEIDILIDLGGHTARNPAGVLAQKPAPIQAIYMGYPCTSGLPATDYIIADRHVCPAESAALYTEQIVWLPDSFLCYQPLAESPPVAPAPCARNGFVTFGSYNNLPKVTRTTLDLWSRILHEARDARLVLKALSFRDAETRELFWRHFQERGIPRERVDLLPPTVPLSRFLEEYGRIDIGLDPLPFNGCTTTCQALWMGVPVLTTPGAHFFSRMGLSILSTLGLDEFIADSPEDYVRRAVALAADRDRVMRLRQELRPRLAASPLCDGAGFTRGLEAVYRNLWRQWCTSPML